MSNGGLPSRSPRAGDSKSFLPSFRAICQGATRLASSVRSAGTSVAASISSAADDRQSEQVQWAAFDMLELQPGHSQRVLLLAYENGFQVWNVENANDVWEVVSKRDGPVALLRIQPQPISDAFDAALDAARPLLLVVTGDLTVCGSNIPDRSANGYSAVVGNISSFGDKQFIPTLVKFYSFENHTFVHTLKFRSAIHSVRCSIRIVAVSTAAQIYCFDAATLKNTFSVITYPSLQPGLNGLHFGYGPMDVGSRWLAYAPNQPQLSNTGRVSPRHLSPSSDVSPSACPANGSLVAYYAKESGKQLAAGIVTLGDLSYKAYSKYCADGLGSTEPGSPLQRNNHNLHAEHAGTVHVRDFVSRVLVAQFRAHESPLSALCFDHTGTLLVTASVHGHNINVFRILPVITTTGSSYDATSSHAHLYKLSRGITSAIIQDIAFSEDGHWIVVSSSKGTNHLFYISPFGGMVRPFADRVDMGLGAVGPTQVLPWWCSLGPVKSTRKASSNPPPVVSTCVVSRIKNVNASWHRTVRSAAVAASGRSSSLPGAVAVTFHDGQGHKLDADANHASLKEQLWALSPHGILSQYAIHLSPITEEISRITPPESPRDSLNARVVVKPLEKWDVSRKTHQVEREERITNLTQHDFIRDTSQSLGGTSTPASFENGGREPISEGMYRLFLSNAEVQMHHLRPPLWSQPQLSFHVFAGLGQSNVGGEIEIEKVATRIVEVRKRDLVPVYDRVKPYQFGDKDSFRDRNDMWGGTLNSPSGSLNQTNARVLPVQHSGSGSSCCLEGSLRIASHGVQNGVHHAYQDLFPYPQLMLESQQSSDQTKSKASGFSGMAEKVSAASVSTIANPLCGFPSLVSHSKALNLQVRESADKEKGPMVKLNNSIGDAGGIANGYLITQGGCTCVSAVALGMDNIQTKEGSCHSSVAPNADQASPRALKNVVGNSDLQDFDGTEDFDSADGNDKSEDFGGDQAEDGWEGAILPFAEDC